VLDEMTVDARVNGVLERARIDAHLSSERGRKQ
jgi:hypothetical protein